MKPKILLVDDEPNIIHSYSRGLRKDWDLVTAMSGLEGLEAIGKHGPFAVIVSDFNMPRMDGITFLRKSIKLDPESVKMMLTGEGDFQIATRAVNEGNIFRFVTKPCPLTQLVKILKDGYKQYQLLQVEKEARQQELTIAGDIQKELLLEKIPVGINSMDIAAKTVPSRGVDGDFIDFFKFSNNSFDLVVGDVMGKGLHAAMVGAGAKNKLLRVLWQLSVKNSFTVPEPTEIMEKLRAELNPGLEQIEKFITMVYARFNNKNKTMIFVDSGHTPVLWYSSKTNKWSKLKGENVPVGLPILRDYVQNTVHFSKKDIFIFYSDGIMEGENKHNEPYGDKAFMKCVKSIKEQSSNQIIDGLIKDYKKFVETDNFFDDLTLVVVKIV